MAQLLGDLQHLRGRELTGLDKDGQAVASVGRLGEDIDVRVLEGRHSASRRSRVNSSIAASLRR